MLLQEKEIAMTPIAQIEAATQTLAVAQPGTTSQAPSASRTVREIALEQPALMRVFENFGIDYCCGGGKTLAEACAARAVEVDRVVAALKFAAIAPAPAAEDWTRSSQEELTAHIVATHHAYVKKELPRLATLAEIVVKRHGAAHPKLPELQAALARLDEELSQHLGKEEAILFPYIVQLEGFLAGQSPRPTACFGAVAKPIQKMTREHEAAGALLAQMRCLSSNFTAPEEACPTFHAFYDGLREFEQDLHRHIHLENNILFPRAVAMEAALEGSR
jgi:regulator of cell morphogenesis and NO signaling